MSDSAVRQWLLEHTPLEPALLHGPGFAAVVAEHVATFARGDESAYLAALEHSPDEVERLAADIAVPETWLFRYPRSFDLLEQVLRRRAAVSPELRMCSVGCATGLEPYAMAMTAAHCGWAPQHTRLDALDRNPEALAIAAAGCYGPSSIRGEIPVWAAEHLVREADSLRIDAGIRAMIRFARVDVTTSGLQGPYDVIFCRNVMIYLNADARTQLMQSIGAALALGGILFVGHAEQFIRGDPTLRPIAAPHAFAFERVNPADPVKAPPHRTPSAAARTLTASSAPPVPAATLRVPTTPPFVPTVVRSSGNELVEARDRADEGRMAEAEQLARSFLARGAPTAAALELLGLIRIAANDATEAKRLFEQAVYLEPGRAACLLQLAMISERGGDTRRASMYWDRARRASRRGDRRMTPSAPDPPHPANPPHPAAPAPPAAIAAAEGTGPLDSAIAQLLNRPVSDADLAAGAEWAARPTPPHLGATIGLLLVRLGDETVALPATVLRRVTTWARPVPIPHRTTPVMRGVCNILGELILCADLHRLLGLPDRTSNDGGSTDARRMVVIGPHTSPWVFEVDKLVGIERVETARLHSPPATVEHATPAYTTGIADIRGQRVTVLDGERVLAGFQAGLA